MRDREQSIAFLRSLKAGDEGTTIYQETIDDVLVELDERAEEIAGLHARVRELKSGYDALDRNWSMLHNAAMGAIRAALDMPDATVPDMVRRIRDLRADAASAVCLRCRTPHDGSQWSSCEYCSVRRTRFINGIEELLGVAGRNLSAEELLEQVRGLP